MKQDSTTAVHANTVTVGTKYPAHLDALVKAIQVKLGDPTKSDTVRRALNEFVERHHPGATRSTT